MKLSGGCLCGEVRYETEGEPVFQVKCYCTDCRRTSASAHAAMMGFPRSVVRIAGEVREYQSKADSGADVARGFCPACGAGVYSTTASMAQLIFLRASTLDDPGRFRPQMIVYASRAPAWDPINDGVPSFPEAPPRPA